MIDFHTKSGSHYRIDMAARTVECIDPPEAAFPARRAAEGCLVEPALGAPFFSFWEKPDDHGRVFLRTSEVVFVGEPAGEGLAL